MGFEIGDLFRFQVSPLELIIRGTVMYWLLFLLFRFVVRRDLGSVGLADILIFVVVADAAQNGMAGDYKTISEGAVLIGTLITWNWIFDRMAYHYEWFARFSEPAPILVIRHGKVLHANLRRHMITVDELKSQVRLQGVESVYEVKYAFLEPDGKLSVVKREN